MNGNFKRGDMVVQIGGKSAYVVSRKHGIWYGVEYLWSNKVFHSDIHRYSIDSNYVKVDFCKNPRNSDEVYAKLIRIAKAFGRTANQ